MDIRTINEEYSVTGQISVSDVDAIKAMGFKSMVCHRPDNEEPGQPAFADIAARAEELGMKITHIPVVGAIGVTPDGVVQMAAAIAEFPAPMLGFCRSGARSTTIYQHAVNQ